MAVLSRASTRESSEALTAAGEAWASFSKTLKKNKPIFIIVNIVLMMLLIINQLFT